MSKLFLFSLWLAGLSTITMLTGLACQHTAPGQEGATNETAFPQLPDDTKSPAKAADPSGTGEPAKDNIDQSLVLDLWAPPFSQVRSSAHFDQKGALLRIRSLGDGARVYLPHLTALKVAPPMPTEGPWDRSVYEKTIHSENQRRLLSVHRRLGDDAVRALEFAAREKNNLAVVCLGELGADARAALPTLLDLVRRDETGITRLSEDACEAVGRLGVANGEVRGVLRETIRRQKTSLGRLALTEAFASYARLGFDTREFVSDLPQALRWMALDWDDTFGGSVGSRIGFIEQAAPIGVPALPALFDVAKAIDYRKARLAPDASTDLVPGIMYRDPTRNRWNFLEPARVQGFRYDGPTALDQAAIVREALQTAMAELGQPALAHLKRLDDTLRPVTELYRAHQNVADLRSQPDEAVAFRPPEEKFLDELGYSVEKRTALRTRWADRRERWVDPRPMHMTGPDLASLFTSRSINIVQGLVSPDEYREWQTDGYGSLDELCTTLGQGARKAVFEGDKDAWILAVYRALDGVHRRREFGEAVEQYRQEAAGKGGLERHAYDAAKAVLHRHGMFGMMPFDTDELAELPDEERQIELDYSVRMCRNPLSLFRQYCLDRLTWVEAVPNLSRTVKTDRRWVERMLDSLGPEEAVVNGRPRKYLTFVHDGWRHLRIHQKDGRWYAVPLSEDDYPSTE